MHHERVNHLGLMDQYRARPACMGGAGHKHEDEPVGRVPRATTTLAQRTRTHRQHAIEWERGSQYNVLFSTKIKFFPLFAPKIAGGARQ